MHEELKKKKRLEKLRKAWEKKKRHIEKIKLEIEKREMHKEMKRKKQEAKALRKHRFKAFFSGIKQKFMPHLIYNFTPKEVKREKLASKIAEIERKEREILRETRAKEKNPHKRKVKTEDL